MEMDEDTLKQFAEYGKQILEQNKFLQEQLAQLQTLNDKYLSKINKFKEVIHFFPFFFIKFILKI